MFLTELLILLNVINIIMTADSLISVKVLTQHHHLILLLLADLLVDVILLIMTAVHCIAETCMQFRSLPCAQIDSAELYAAVLTAWRVCWKGEMIIVWLTHRAEEVEKRDVWVSVSVWDADTWDIILIIEHEWVGSSSGASEDVEILLSLECTLLNSQCVVEWQNCMQYRYIDNWQQQRDENATEQLRLVSSQTHLLETLWVSELLRISLLQRGFTQF